MKTRVISGVFFKPSYLIPLLFPVFPSIWAADGTGSPITPSVPRAPAPEATNQPKNEIRVILFGQPCLLSGPVSSTMLKTIHMIGPEQIPVPAPDTLEQARTLIARLESAVIPEQLESYRRKQIKRLKAHAAYLEGYLEARKLGKPEALIEKVRPHQDPQKTKTFESIASKTDLKSGSESLRDAFNDSIEPSPDEEFHSQRELMDVRYSCTMDEMQEISTETQKLEPESRPSPPRGSSPRRSQPKAKPRSSK